MEVLDALSVVKTVTVLVLVDKLDELSVVADDGEDAIVTSSTLSPVSAGVGDTTILSQVSDGQLPPPLLSRVTETEKTSLFCAGAVAKPTTPPKPSNEGTVEMRSVG